MTENVDFGSQRLQISQALGSEFTISLESGSELSPLAQKVRSHLLQHPGTQVIGAKVGKDAKTQDVINTLNIQMGLPENSGLGALRDRLFDRKDDFVLVLLGTKDLQPINRKDIFKKLKGLVKTTFTDSESEK